MHSIGLFAMFITLGVHGIKVPQVSNANTKRFKVISIPYTEVVAMHTEITELPPDHSMGDMLAYEPLSPEKDDVFVFIPGSWATCGDYSEFLEFVGKSMHTLCLPYDNIESVGQLCQNKTGDCWLETRSIAYDGDFANIKDNNQHDRLVSALKFLINGGHSPKWKKYLTASDEPKWSSMRVSGHSQGAGSAAVIGYKNEVARVVQFAGPCDNSNWTQAQPKTPSTRFYGLQHSKDMCVPAQKHWKLEGATKRHEPMNITEEAVKSNTVGSTLHVAKGQGAQTVVSSIPYKCPQKEARIVDNLPQLKEDACAVAGHETIVQNDYWLPGERNPYAADGIWNFVVGL